MFKDERQLARHIASKMRSEPSLGVKLAISGDEMSKKGFEDVLSRYFGAHAPMYVARPDVVVVVEDVKRVVDEWLLIAIELKYFRDLEDARRFGRRLRRAFREIGQPLRYYLYGFDSAVLWHVFEEGAGEEVLRSYGDLISEFIEKLKLPMAFFLTKIVGEDSFLVFKPSEVGSPYSCGDITRWILDYCRGRARNLLLPHDEEIRERRRALKIALKVP